jgi:carboxyl-terminal processing protease
MLHFILFFLLSCSCLGWAEQRYLQTKDINTIMQQILGQQDKKEVTTSILRNSFRVYLDQFDPDRIYLLQQEADPFLNIGDARLQEFLDQYKKGEYKEYEALNQTIQQAIERARKIRARLQTNERSSLFQESALFHSDGNEEWTDPDLKKFFAKNEAELAERIKREIAKFISIQKKRYGAEYVRKKEEQLLQLLDREFQQHENGYLFVNEKNEPMDASEKQNDFVMHILKALASSLDAHTTVLNPLEAQDMRLRLEKEIEGIGIGLRPAPDGGFFISRIVQGGPAANSGQVHLDDRLLEIDHKPVQGKELSQVMEMIRGTKGSKVTVLLKHAETIGGIPVERNVSVDLQREEVTVNEDRAQSWFETFGTQIIGIIKLDSFYQSENGISSETDLRAALNKLNRQGNLGGVILDLRENSGGFLSQAVKVVGLFISNGIVVISKYFNGEEHFYRDVEGKQAYNGPLIILTSKATASAAEIVAQALQDYGTALIVGDKQTYGKGTIQSQTITQAGNTAFFKVTVGKYYTVSGRTPQMEGVKADIIVPGPFANEKIGEKYLDYPVTPDSIPAAYNDNLSDITPNLKPWYMHYYLPTLQKKQYFWQNHLEQLRRNSSYRINHNKDYQAFLNQGENEEGNYGQEDLQLQEAVHIMKDMIVLKK